MGRAQPGENEGTETGLRVVTRATVTTLLELVGFASIAAGIGLAFGLAAFLIAAGTALVILGVVLEVPHTTVELSEAR